MRHSGRKRGFSFIKTLLMLVQRDIYSRHGLLPQDSCNSQCQNFNPFQARHATFKSVNSSPKSLLDSRNSFHFLFPVSTLGFPISSFRFPVSPLVSGLLADFRSPRRFPVSSAGSDPLGGFRYKTVPSSKTHFTSN